MEVEIGGLEVSDVAKMRRLEEENRRLKRLLDDPALEIDALKLIASGNPAQRRRTAAVSAIVASAVEERPRFESAKGSHSQPIE
jgi:hypothetical protein